MRFDPINPASSDQGLTWWQSENPGLILLDGPDFERHGVAPAKVSIGLGK